MSYHPSFPYESRLPPQPRLTIPPPDVDPLAARQVTANPLTSILRPPPTHPFLPTLDPQAFLTFTTRVEWKYNDRRKAQCILPFLYLGPFPTAKDGAFLRSEGITMVVAIRNTLSAQANLLTSKTAEKLGVEAATVDVRGNQELIAAFPRATNLINAHLSRLYQHDVDRYLAQHNSLHRPLQLPQQFPLSPFRASTPGKVLLYCESGNERSAAVAAAYVMDMYALDLVGAIQLLQNQRFCVGFDDDMKNLLYAYADLLVAKRDVARSRAVTPNLGVGGTFSNGESGMAVDSAGWHVNGLANDRSASDANNIMNTSSFTLSKRRLDNDDEGMGGVEWNMDDARFERREGFAPFVESVKDD